MNINLLRALIHWVEVIHSVVLYMAVRQVPAEYRVDLHNATKSLTDELNKVMEL